MGVKRTNVPAIPEPTEFNTVEVIKAIKEVLEVGQSWITRGDELDAWVTFRDLADGSAYSSFAAYSQVDGGALTLGEGDRPGDDSPFPGGVNPCDLILPGRPTGVKTSPVWDSIMVEWDWPTGSPDISWTRAEIYVSATPDFSNANLLGYSASNFFVHSDVGLSDLSQQNAETGLGIRYYWVRFQDVDHCGDSGEWQNTDWTPYEWEDGIKGITSWGTDLTASFWIPCGENGTSLDEIFLCYTNDEGEQFVGLPGHFIVDGSITAQQIQANSIGAREVRAEEIWSDILNANQVISTQFATRPSPFYRLEINGWGSEQQNYPLWYGRGPTGGDDGLFWFQNYTNQAGNWQWSTMFLSGEMYVTGAGKFFAGNTTVLEYDENGEVIIDEDGNPIRSAQGMRIEIGGPDTDFVLWAGSGQTGTGDNPESDSNPVFFIDNSGNAVFAGTVEAKYVSGEITRTLPFRSGTQLIAFNSEQRNVPIGLSPLLSESGTPIPLGGEEDIHLLDSDKYWQTVGEWELPASPFAGQFITGREGGQVPSITITMNLYGGYDVMRYRIQMLPLQWPTRPWDGDPDIKIVNWWNLLVDVFEEGGYGEAKTITTCAPRRLDAGCKFRLQFAKFKDSWGGEVKEGANSASIGFINGYALGHR
jgi:hypothetical protein